MSDTYADAKAMWKQHSLRIVSNEVPSTESQRVIAWRFLKNQAKQQAAS